MANNKQKAQIHILKDDLSLSRDDYEAMLSGWGVASSADPGFSTKMADELIIAMRRMKDRSDRNLSDQIGHGWGKHKYEHLRPRPARMADPKQLRKIEAMWRDLARDPRDSALQSFIERLTGIKNIIWLQKKHVEAVLCAEEEIKNNQKEVEYKNGH